jgi:hypothetical protein
MQFARLTASYENYENYENCVAHVGCSEERTASVEA